MLSQSNCSNKIPGEDTLVDLVFLGKVAVGEERLLNINLDVCVKIDEGIYVLVLDTGISLRSGSSCFLD